MRSNIRFAFSLSLVLALAACDKDTSQNTDQTPGETDPCKLPQNAEHPACVGVETDPCKLAENLDHPACVGGDLCAHPDFAETAGCVAIHCEKLENYLDEQCVTPLRKTMAELAQIDERSALCVNDDPIVNALFTGEGTAEVQMITMIFCDKPADSSETLETNACATNGLIRYINVMTAATGMSFPEPSVPCASCLAIEGSCVMDKCFEQCSTGDSSCEDCIDAHKPACTEQLIKCGFGSDLCADVDCGSYACNPINGECLDSCDGMTDLGCSDDGYCNEGICEPWP